MSDADAFGCDNPIVNVFVIGFHHKKGCMVEYSYPPLFEVEPAKGGELPELWKHLPTLALPDGAHNYEQDTIYFHLPSLENPQQTVFGISCYRQMNAENLINRSSDITRDTVQKSVCVISKVPLYGLIQAKLELITHAYFDERDFSKVSLLEETFKNLNSSLPKDLSEGHQAYLGLSVRDFVLRFKHKTLLLFKLLMLEKKVLFYKAPVKILCSTVLTLCSLIPGMIEQGLSESAILSSRLNSPSLEVPDSISITCNEHDSTILNNTASNGSNPSNSTVTVILSNEALRPRTLGTKKHCESGHSSQNSSDTEGDSWVKCNHLTPDIGSSATSITSSTCTETKDKVDDKLMQSINELLDGEDRGKLKNSSLKFQDDVSSESSEKPPSAINEGISNIMSSLRGSKSSALPSGVKGENGAKILSAHNSVSEEGDSQRDVMHVIDLEPNECGLPLQIFTKNVLCHPYLSLPFLDILSDVGVRACIIGATNILFKQKKQLFDVVIEVDEGKIEILDPELKKQLNLTTEDLRFADHLVRHVMEDKEDVFLDGTGWEGGDEWLRSQFKLYLLSVMRTSEVEANGKEGEPFNISFMNAWKTTYNYKIWNTSSHLGILQVNPGHPFHGQLSMADMKLKFSHTMQNTERGRRINTAVLNTGKAVVQTGKAVGGALTSAKSAVSSWWSSLNVPAEKSNAEENGDDSSENKSESGEAKVAEEQN